MPGKNPRSASASSRVDLCPTTHAGGACRVAGHAEESRPGGDVLSGDTPDAAVRFAEVFTRLMAYLVEVSVGSSETFLAVGQDTRARSFTTEEEEVA